MYVPLQLAFLCDSIAKYRRQGRKSAERAKEREGRFSWFLKMREGDVRDDTSRIVVQERELWYGIVWFMHAVLCCAVWCNKVVRYARLVLCACVMCGEVRRRKKGGMHEYQMQAMHAKLPGEASKHRGLFLPSHTQKIEMSQTPILAVRSHILQYVSTSQDRGE